MAEPTEPAPAILRCIDLETTGLEPPAYPIEFGCCDVRLDPLDVGFAESFLFNPKPGEKIPSSAMAVHHITNEMLAEPDVLGRDLAVEKITEALGEPAVVAIVAHQARFERQWLNAMTGKPWICTWKVACNQFPDLAEHNLQFIRYEFGLDKQLPEGESHHYLMPPHRAAPDALLCALLVAHFLAHGITVQQMIEISGRPCLLPRVTFGKHIGQKWHEVPSSYLDWVIKNIQDDEDVQFTARYWHRIKTQNKARA